MSAIVGSLTRTNFVNHGHKLDTSDWSAWYSAYKYAEEHHPEYVKAIDKGCDCADKQKPVPDKYLKVAQQLYATALKEV